MKSLFVLAILFSLAFAQEKTTGEKVGEKIDEVIEAVEEVIGNNQNNNDVAVTKEEQVSEEQDNTVKYENLAPEIQKALKKYHELNAKLAVLEASPAPNGKEIAKTQQKMITYQQQLEQSGLSIEEATAQMQQYQELQDQLNKERVLYRFFEAQANNAWFTENPKVIEEKKPEGVDKLQSKIEKLKTKLAREEFKLAFISERLANPDEYLKGTYIFQFAHTTTQETIEAIYATLAEKSIQVLHKYAIGNSFRGFSAEVSDTDLPWLLENENITSFESEGEATLFAQESAKFKQIFAAIHDACDVGSECSNNEL